MGNKAMKMVIALFSAVIMSIFISNSIFAQAAPATPSAAISTAGRNAVVLPLKYQAPKRMLEVLKEVMGDIKASADEVRKSILIFDTDEKINQAKKIISLQDIPYKQVVISVRVAEVSYTDTKNVGWGLTNYNVSLKTLLPPSGKTLTVNSLGDMFPGTVEFGGENSRTKVLAKPKIMVVDEQKAQLGRGDRVPIPISQSQVVQGQVATSTSVQFEEVGVKLT
ncbi:MAG: secretin N-terminal domain-containing protein, partial [Nanoarchaeota archaeon]